MIISASRVLEHVNPTSVVKVVDMEGEDAFPADYQRILELVAEQQVCGYLRGSRLKYLELLVPISEAKPKSRQIETSGSVNAQTNIGAYRQHLAEGTCWSLCMCRAFDGARA